MQLIGISKQSHATGEGDLHSSLVFNYALLVELCNIHCDHQIIIKLLTTWAQEIRGEGGGGSRDSGADQPIDVIV